MESSVAMFDYPRIDSDTRTTCGNSFFTRLISQVTFPPSHDCKKVTHATPFEPTKNPKSEKKQLYVSKWKTWFLGGFSSFPCHFHVISMSLRWLRVLTFLSLRTFFGAWDCLRSVPWQQPSIFKPRPWTNTREIQG